MTKKEQVINKNKNLPKYKETIKKEKGTLPFNIFAADPLKGEPDATGWAFLVEFPQYFARGKDRKEATKKLMKIVSARISNDDFVGTDKKIAESMRFLLHALGQVSTFEVVGFNLSVNVINDRLLEN